MQKLLQLSLKLKPFHNTRGGEYKTYGCVPETAGLFDQRRDSREYMYRHMLSDQHLSGRLFPFSLQLLSLQFLLNFIRHLGFNLTENRFFVSDVFELK